MNKTFLEVLRKEQLVVISEIANIIVTRFTGVSGPSALFAYEVEEDQTLKQLGSDWVSGQSEESIREDASLFLGKIIREIFLKNRKPNG